MYNYDQAVELLLSLVDMERHELSMPRQKQIYDLSRISLFLTYCGNPELDIKCLHIAGTKGKGSAAALCDSILMSAGFKTGFFSSPHIHRFNERIRINGKPIAPDKFAFYCFELWNIHCEWVNSDCGSQLTLFEFLTVLSFHVFRQEKVEISVIEVGLGGRLDATNVVTPEVSIITALGYDHMNILGDTIEEITREKAGIIKPGIPTVLAPQIYPISDIVRQVCTENKSLLLEVSNNANYKIIEVNKNKQSIEFTRPKFNEIVTTSLLGTHQIENILTAIMAMQLLSNDELPITNANIVEGIQQLNWPCRLEPLEYEGMNIVVDGAHTYESVKMAIQGVHEYFNFEEIIVLLGLSKDKNIQEICDLIIKLEPKSVELIKSRHPKAINQTEMLNWFKSSNISVNCWDSIPVCIETLKENSNRNELVLSIGSFFSSAEVREYVLNLEPEIYPSL